MDPAEDVAADLAVCVGDRDVLTDQQHRPVVAPAAAASAVGIRIARPRRRHPPSRRTHACFVPRSPPLQAVARVGAEPHFLDASPADQAGPSLQ